MGSQINKSQIDTNGHLPKQMQRPQAKAVFMEVKVNDPGTPINSSSIESDNFVIDDKMLSCQQQNGTTNIFSNYGHQQRNLDSKIAHIQSLKGILKKETSNTQTPSRYFNEEARFVRFQHNYNCQSPHKFNQKNISRKSRISSLF